MNGYNQTFRRIESEKNTSYNTLPSEIPCDIVYVDYDRGFSVIRGMSGMLTRSYFIAGLRFGH